MYDTICVHEVKRPQLQSHTYVHALLQQAISVMPVAQNKCNICRHNLPTTRRTSHAAKRNRDTPHKGNVLAARKAHNIDMEIYQLKRNSTTQTYRMVFDSKSCH